MAIAEHKSGELLCIPMMGRFAIMFHIPGHCAGCKMAKSVLENKKLEDITIMLVDAEDEGNKDLVKLYNATTAPTFIVFEDGSEIARLEGLKDFLARQKELFGD